VPEVDDPYSVEQEQMIQRVQSDLEYIRNWNIFFDLKIIFPTIIGAMKGRNVY
jgi:lipopolysaccharide/colanic/teichoic acid biosynthesis glycosyltransferase